ncbi:hypothetical protein TEA_022149 [Camellia sinensis var. sinensis]|uniref:Uncharacterized protein n=1 Tax=Camellia sinensis var. sinensis TaxID=542762 RepID=A0A4S4DQM3_CAMSN|nr:hypothetical protein TEA_022149 [Camellia sinensis var. sinensis]
MNKSQQLEWDIGEKKNQSERDLCPVDANDAVTGHIISTTIGGKNGKPKQCRTRTGYLPGVGTRIGTAARVPGTAKRSPVCLVQLDTAWVRHGYAFGTFQINKQLVLSLLASLLLPFCEKLVRIFGWPCILASNWLEFVSSSLRLINNLTTLADMKRVWLSRKFSFIFEASPSTNLAIFMQSLYAHSIETSSMGEKMVEEEKGMGSEGKGNGGGGGEREMSGGGEGEVTVARERKWEGSVMGGMGQGSGCR